jgi:hypothetical protein
MMCVTHAQLAFYSQKPCVTHAQLDIGGLAGSGITE